MSSCYDDDDRDGNPMLKIPLIQRILSFASRTPHEALELREVTLAFDECVCSYGSALWHALRLHSATAPQRCLFEACKRCIPWMVVGLMRGGVSPSVVDELWYQTPMAIAAEKNHANIIDVLLEHGATPADVNKIAKSDGAPLHIAIIHNSVEAAKLLVERGGADVNLKADIILRREDTPLLLAVGAARSPELVEFLLKHGADVRALDMNDRTCLTVLDPQLGDRAVAIAKMLLEADAAVAADCAGGGPASLVNTAGPTDTPLVHACKVGNNVELVKLLIAHGADVNGGGGPLFVALRACQWDTAVCLLAAGADPKPRAQQQASASAGTRHQQQQQQQQQQQATTVTPLLLAVRGGSTETCKALLDRGVDPDQISPTVEKANNDASWTTTRPRAAAGAAAAPALLLTPLQQVLRKDFAHPRKPLVHVLLEKGAAVDESVIRMALELSGAEDVVELLLQAHGVVMEKKKTRRGT